MCDTIPMDFERGICDYYSVYCIDYVIECHDDGMSGEQEFRLNRLDFEQCDSPPSVTIEVEFKDTPYTVVVSGNTTEMLGSAEDTLTATVWYYDYSMDLQVTTVYEREYRKRVNDHSMEFDKQWNPQIIGTLGPSISSFIERLSSH